MMRKGHFTAIATVLSLFTIFLLIVGCSDNTSETYSNTPAAIVQPGNPGDVRPEIAENRINATAEIVSANTGGEVDIPLTLGSKAVLDVPAGAISTDTTITASVQTISMKNQAALQFNFEPDGLVFKTEAVLTIDAKAFGRVIFEYVDWYYFNPESNAWEYVDRYYVQGGKIVIKLPHFSKWLAISQGGQ